VLLVHWAPIKQAPLQAALQRRKKGADINAEKKPAAGFSFRIPLSTAPLFGAAFPGAAVSGKGSLPRNRRQFLGLQRVREAGK
jgi:hypothetical protein